MSAGLAHIALITDFGTWSFAVAKRIVVGTRVFGCGPENGSWRNAQSFTAIGFGSVRIGVCIGLAVTFHGKWH